MKLLSIGLGAAEGYLTGGINKIVMYRVGSGLVVDAIDGVMSKKGVLHSVWSRVTEAKKK